MDTRTAGVDAMSGRRAYRSAIGLLRLAWTSCALAVLAVLAALVLRSPVLVRGYELLLALTCAAAVLAALVVLVLSVATRTRVGVVLTMLLGDLLDPP